jgi:Carboxypeptidase regulatory-like domain
MHFNPNRFLLSIRTEASLRGASVGRLLVRIVATFLIGIAPLCLAQAPNTVSAIDGQVLCSDTQAPARNATVRLRSLQESPGNNTSLLTTSTDLSGHFHLNAVSPGKYSVDVSFAGYLSPRETNQPVAVVNAAPGATASIDILLRRGAVMSGSVTYKDQSPAIGIEVAALLLSEEQGERHSRKVASALVDTFGHFMLAGLPAGSYTILAASVETQQGREIQVYLGGASALSGAQTIELTPPELRKDLEFMLPQ